jgi:hypothetical protein
LGSGALAGRAIEAEMARNRQEDAA